MLGCLRPKMRKVWIFVSATTGTSCAWCSLIAFEHIFFWSTFCHKLWINFSFYTSSPTYLCCHLVSNILSRLRLIVNRSLRSNLHLGHRHPGSEEHQRDRHQLQLHLRPTSVHGDPQTKITRWVLADDIDNKVRNLKNC